MTEQQQVQQAEEQKSAEEQGTEQQSSESTSEGYRSQEDFDKAFARKLEKEREKIRADVRKEAEDAAKQASMNEAEKEKAAREKAESRAAEREKSANDRVIRSEAKLTALNEGAKPDRVNAVLRLADLSEVDLDDAGEPDADALSKAVSRVLLDYPEFKASTNVGGGGSNPAGGSGGTEKKNPWKSEHFNLTEQGRIQMENPALAERLKAEAQ